MPPQNIKIKTGIEIWDGLPGSGKSYSAVEELIKIIMVERRPVYTNLPLKLKVLRTLLVLRSMNPSTANYIQYLDREHFSRFVERNQIWSEFSEPMKAAGYGHAYIERAFAELHGEGKITGEDADWIPTGSVLILDEFHRWADQRMQRAEDPAYLLYATMHRHHMHRILVLTQDAMQVSITWRRNSDTLVHHTDKRKLPFMFGITLPIPAFAREFWPKEYIDQSRIGQKPTKTEVFIPSLSNGLIWRCYDSFTHMGGARRLNRAIEKTRKQVEGDQYQPQNKEQNDMASKSSWGKRIKGFVKNMAFACILIAIMIGLYGMKNEVKTMQKNREAESKKLQQQLTAIRQEMHRQPRSGQTTNRYQNNEPPKVTMIANGYCMANGQITREGQLINGFTLKEINNEASTTKWIYRDMDFIVPIARMQPKSEYRSGQAGSTQRKNNKRRMEPAGLGSITR